MSHRFGCPCNSNLYASCECAAIDQREHTDALNRNTEALKGAVVVRQIAENDELTELRAIVDGLIEDCALVGGRYGVSTISRQTLRRALAARGVTP